MKSTFLERLTSKKTRLRRLKKRVIEYFSNLPQESVPAEQRKIVGFLKDHDISVFPYSFPAEYQAADIELFKDEQLNLYYMMWEGKKLYYKNGNRPKKARQYFNSLRLEQDIRSPHRYLTNDFDVAENDVVVDVGAAEGNFSLSVVEKAGYVFLFETDIRWIKALEATFAPWKDKVKIIQKYVSDKTDGQCIALDDFFGDKQTIHFIKADVEGAEGQILQGATNVINRHTNLRVAVCTYHRQEDADVLEGQLKKLGFKTSFADGYLLYYYGKTNVVREPFLRKAVLRAVKG